VTDEGINLSTLFSGMFSAVGSSHMFKSRTLRCQGNRDHFGQRGSDHGTPGNFLVIILQMPVLPWAHW